MLRLLSPALLIGFGLLPLSRADAPPPKPPAPPRIESLIGQLADQDFRRRAAATRALAALGTEALPALQQARSHPDPEVRRRLDELIPPMERMLALAPKQITLHMTNRPIREIFGELSKQTGYKFAGLENQPGEQNKQVYTFDFDGVPFWQAMDQVCEAGGFVLQQNYQSDDSLRLFYQPDSYVPFVSYDGAFKVIPTGFNYSRSNHFAQIMRNRPDQQRFESLHVNLTLAVEPKLPILRVGSVRLSMAEDEERHSMLPAGTETANGMWAGRHSYYGGGYRSYVQQTQALLILPSRTSRTVRILKGVIPVTLLADQKPAVITDRILAAKGKKFTSGAATFIIEDVSELAGKQHQIKISVTEDSKDSPNDWTRIQSLQQRIELQDEKGNKEQFYFNSIGSNGINSAQYTLTVGPNDNAKIGPPARLVYYSWILMEHEVPFELKDLPLP
ncbi:MAG TPA: hypothetical protein VKU02_22935 [Gemmataceae bacterium]|nr:hypothetical protein [Gemmataceae bacterium]